MRSLAFVSHKECWRCPETARLMTVGGFPAHVRGIASLADELSLAVPILPGPPPDGAGPLPPNLRVVPLDVPRGTGVRRKLGLLAWAPRNIPSLWRLAGESEAMHVTLPGDIGLCGLAVGLLRGAPMLVRHCGTWGAPRTIADRLTFRLLEQVAGRRVIVLATGAGTGPPSRRNGSIRWIFSTALTEQDLASVRQASPWVPGEPLRLVTVSRLTRDKNVAATIAALPRIRAELGLVELHVVGTGEEEAELRRLAGASGVAEAVTFHGQLAHSSVLRLLGSSHVFVFPTRAREGFPKALVEAMACGLPVLVSDLAALRHIVEPDRGVVLEGSDAEDIARAMTGLCRDPRRMAELGAAARAASRRYSLERWQALLAEYVATGDRAWN